MHGSTCCYVIQGLSLVPPRQSVLHHPCPVSVSHLYLLCSFLQPLLISCRPLPLFFFTLCLPPRSPVSPHPTLSTSHSLVLIGLKAVFLPLLWLPPAPPSFPLGPYIFCLPRTVVSLYCRARGTRMGRRGQGDKASGGPSLLPRLQSLLPLGPHTTSKPPLGCLRTALFTSEGLGTPGLSRVLTASYSGVQHVWGSW